MPGAGPAMMNLLSKQSSKVIAVQAPHSAVDARDLIQDQLGSNKSINARQAQSFRSALKSLHEALKSKVTIYQGQREAGQAWSCADPELAIADWTTPPLATVQWMLTSAFSITVRNEFSFTG